MSIKASKKAYDKLVKSGDLFEMFPTMKGVWKEDKEDFLMMYNQNLDLNLDLYDLDVEDNFSYEE